jgi:alpha-tubulin suppressor-like RCC1 family protein
VVIVAEKEEGGCELWSWGCNDDGALGREGEETQPAKITGLENENIVGGSGGDNHTTVFDDQGRVWAWGVYKDGNGYLGFKRSQEGKQLNPTLITELHGLTNFLLLSSLSSPSSALRSLFTK